MWDDWNPARPRLQIAEQGLNAELHFRNKDPRRVVSAVPALPAPPQPPRGLARGRTRSGRFDRRRV